MLWPTQPNSSVQSHRAPQQCMRYLSTSDSNELYPHEKKFQLFLLPDVTPRWNAACAKLFIDVGGQYCPHKPPGCNITMSLL